MKNVSHTSHALLGLLSFHAMSGYDVRRLIPESIGHFWSESYGQIYPALKAMAADGLVSKKTERHSGKPDRHVYALTEAGRQELAAWLGMPVAVPVPRSELLLKIFFGAHAAPSVSREHVLAHRAWHRAAAKTYAAIERQLQKDEADDPQLPFWLMTLSYGGHTSRAVTAWCDGTLRKLDRLDGTKPKRKRGGKRDA